jgi:radical SAM protein with 4Fe4S-binding SPASM domain
MVDHGKTEEQKMDVYREWTSIVNGITLMPSLLPDNSCEDKKQYVHNAKLMQRPPFCAMPFQMLMISWDGRVSACCLDWCYNIVLGNAKHQSLKEIWQGPGFQALRKASLAGSFPKGSPCEHCEFWQLNFEPKEEPILEGHATINYANMYKAVKRNPEKQ